jgi:hypothetical protein
MPHVNETTTAAIMTSSIDDAIKVVSGDQAIFAPFEFVEVNFTKAASSSLSSSSSSSS